MTENMERRFKEHQNGNVKSTRQRRPLELIYKEIFTTKKEAETREKFFKTGKGREYLKEVLNL
jgi:putative endonuclease